MIKAQDVKPPAGKPYPAPADTELKTEMVKNVPVQHPNGSVQSTRPIPGNPIAGTSFINSVKAGQEAEMDKILEEVNKKVKSAGTNKSSGHSWRDFFKPPAPQDNIKNPAYPKGRPVAVTVIAVLVGITLAIAAYYAFLQSQAADQPAGTGSELQTSDTTTSDNSSVTASDVDTLSKEVQTQVDDLKDSQSFDSASLSDTTLGL